MDDILQSTFEESHLAARRNQSIPAGRSGTTCVLCLLDNNHMLYTAVVGDSRAILGIMKDKRLTKIITLSSESTTRRESERQRIEEFGEGRIDSGGNLW